MKRDLSISFSFHLILLLTALFSAKLLKLAAKPSYPAVYTVNLVALPKVSGDEGQDMTSAPASASPAAKPAEKPLPGTKRSKDKKKTEKKDRKSGGPVVPNLPKGMNVLSAEGVSPEGSYYLGMILTKISQYWRNPYQGGKQEIRATIYFKIDRNGNLLEAILEKPSGDAIFDQAAIRAVYQAKNFPPFPPEMKVSVLGVHFEFEYVK